MWILFLCSVSLNMVTFFYFSMKLWFYWVCFVNENSRQNFTYSVLFCLHNNMERVVDPHFGEEEMSLYSEITWSRPFSCQGRLGSEPQWACSKDCFFLPRHVASLYCLCNYRFNDCLKVSLLWIHLNAVKYFIRYWENKLEVVFLHVW